MSKSKIILTADDYGVDDMINQGIMNLARWGILNSVEVLANYGPDGSKSVENTLKLLDDTEELHPELELGVHLTITSGKPLTSDPGLEAILHKGHFISAKGTNSKATPTAIYKELEAQVNVLRNNKRIWSKVTHLTNHHDALWFFPEYTAPYIQLANDLGLPIRNPEVIPELKEALYYSLIGPRAASSADKEKSRKAYRLRERGEFESQELNYRSTNYLDSAHYSLFRTIVESNPYKPEEFIARRQAVLRGIFERVNEIATERHTGQIVEGLFHVRLGGVNGAERKLGFWERLKKGKKAFDKYDLPDYNGITTKYFDGRYIEYMSLAREHDSGGLKKLYEDNNVEKGRWEDCIPRKLYKSQG